MTQDTNKTGIAHQERASTGIEGAHEMTIRELRLGSQGVEVGEALRDFEGVFSGVTTYRGTVPLLSETGGPEET